MGHEAPTNANARHRLKVPIPIPCAYEVIVRDRANRNQQQLRLCDEHLDRCRKSARVVLTGTLSPVECCDECQREAAAALESAAARMQVRL